MPEIEEAVKELMKGIEEAVLKCWNCNFCISACPIFTNTGGFYSRASSGLTQSLYYAVRWGLLDGPENQELMKNIFRCTTCNACVNRCKDLSAGIPLMEIVERGRALLVEKGIGPMPDQRKVLESIFMYGNPYRQPADKRFDWLEDPGIKKMPAENAQVLFFVGCSTSYEPLLHNTGRSLVKLLQAFNVDFGVMEEEKCSAETVLRLGDEVLFEELSSRNAEAFRATGAKTIVTASPHDFDIFSTRYPSLKDHFEIKHYTEFFAQRLKDFQGAFNGNGAVKVTYHDPCYLSKRHGITEPPRKLLEAVPGLELVELRLNGKDSFCCGGGGGRMFTEVEERRRLSDMRVGQALETGAQVLATACPWCRVMLDNAVRDLKVEDRIEVKDVAEILAGAVG